MKPSVTWIIAVLLAIGASRSPALAASPTAIADGSAYAALINANVGGPNSLSAGPIAPASLDCDTKSATSTNSVASINLGSILTTSGTASDMVSSSYTNSVAVQSVSTIQGVNLLSGIVTATAVQAESNSVFSGGVASSNASGSAFANLTVNGQPISGTPPPNTRISLAGLGVLILNEQIVSHNQAEATNLTVNMIHVRITHTNVFGLPVGSNIIVGHAESDIATPPVPVTLDAESYALYATGLAGQTSGKSGPWAPARIPCIGGSAQDDLAQLQLSFADLGTMMDAASGQIGSSTSSAMAQSQVQNVNVLDGLISANAVTVNAAASIASSPSRSGSTSIVNGFVAGVQVSSSPAPNTTINVANLGYVVLNEQIGSMGPHSAKITVNAIHLVVTTTNVFGLPVGASIIVGHATAGAKRF